MLALEKPHWGVSGVPFMKSTTGFDATAWSIADRVSADKNRSCEDVYMTGRGMERKEAIDRGRDACRKAYSALAFSSA